MTAIIVNQQVLERLKQAYSEKFGGSPKLLINELNNIYQNKTTNLKDVISDKTIRNFFNNAEPMKMQEKNLNFLCGVLLGCESYQEALRQQAALEEVEQQHSDLNVEWFERYQEYLRTKCGTMKVLTMTQPVQLDSIYANVNVLESIKGKKRKLIEDLISNISNESISFSRLNYKVTDKSIVALDSVKRYQKLLIWGSPGAGKTTFLKYLALHSNTEFGKQIVPIFISLKAFAEEEDKPNLIDVIRREFNVCFPEPAQFVQELLEQGNCLILLDGLDEIAESESNRIYRNINTFVEQFSKNRFIMTCRSGASDYTFEHFTEVEMADFNENQVLMFVKKWFASSQEPKLGDRFLEEVERNISIKELAINPLLLTMLCLVFEDNYEFPKNRYLLIEDAVNILIRKWDASRRIERDSINSFNLPYQRKVNMLSQIAYEAFNQEPQKFFWQQRELEKTIRNYIKNILESSSDNFDNQSLEVLKTVEVNHGLIVKQTKDLYSFSHLTFQEYFVAHYIIENRNTEIFNEVIKHHLTKRQWREVFLMIAGRLANADEFLKLMFQQINKLVKSQALQDMLTWLDDVTTFHAVKSSSWRAFYLFVDQIYEIYTNRVTKNNYSLAQGILIQRLAVILRQINVEQEKIIKRPQLANFSLNLVDIYAHVDARANEKEFDLQKVSPLLRKELPVSDEPFMIPQLISRVNIDKEQGIITMHKQEGQIILDKEHFPNQDSDSDVSIEQESNHSNDEDLNNHTLKMNNYEDLLEELLYLKDSFPYENAPKWEWQEWAKKLKGFMRLYLHIGFDDVKLSQEQIKSLEDYFYANILLIECIQGGSYSSKDLRNQLIDHLLLPSKRIPSELLSLSYKNS
ncbi:MAG: NACHT domain-containing protein [Mojavia pulchra JT2-VF2]|jgi:energy-coupling factor transporter ATP-binding protein EcfA2|uniref:NACHT domain-containing protein n=1 Tax=Mojavia pulchra JT2-VF2 TaxID=287848 RepID=A0A951UJ96_9NOST|nr:NACHT domain-containing protein [Mojavia pulchra JT2-VF2]